MAKLSEFSKDIFDQESFLEWIENDNELFYEVIDIYLTDTPKQLESLKQSFQDGDRIQSEKLAHTMHGAAANLHANAAKNAAYEVEQAAQKGTLHDSPHLIEQVEAEVQRLQEILRSLQS